MKGGVIALVTARGGSKRLPGKNVYTIAGKPLIAWTIEAALAAPSVRRVVVSTDASDIAEIARAHGAEVPFVRPADLSGDHASHVAVAEHALDWLNSVDDTPEYLLLLQPTSPLRTARDIEGIIAFARSHSGSSVVSVRPVVDHPLLCRSLDGAGRLVPYAKQSDSYLRTQDLPPAFAINGALYLIRPAELVMKKSFLSEETLGYVMSMDASVDIDDLNDLVLAEQLLLARSKRESGKS